MYTFILRHDVIVVVTLADGLKTMCVDFPQRLKWLPSGFSTTCRNCDFPITKNFIEKDLNRQIEIWYRDRIVTGEPWDWHVLAPGPAWRISGRERIISQVPVHACRWGVRPGSPEFHRRQ